MALDEPRETDEIFDVKGLVFLMDKLLFEIAKPVRIDLEGAGKEGGFTISSNISDNNSSIAEDPGACYASCTI